MTNLTITVEDNVLKHARMRALDQGTSVNVVLRDFLRTYAARGGAREAGARIRQLSEQSHSGSGPQGRTWTRDELHER